MPALSVDSNLSTTEQYIKDASGNTSPLAIGGTGSLIGMGTTDPLTGLHIKGINPVPIISLEDTNTGTTSRWVLDGGSSGAQQFRILENLTFIKTYLTIGSGEVIFNDLATDIDFRVEGDTDSNLLKVDASTDRVGIGTSSPGAKLDVRGSAVFNEDGANNDFRVEGDADPNMLFINANQDRMGIGTSSPSEKLHLSGGNFLMDNNKQIKMKNTAGNPLRIMDLDDGNNLNIGRDDSIGSTQLFGDIAFYDDAASPSIVVQILPGGSNKIK